MRWSYGLTTTPARLDSLLPKTLASLAEAGFDTPFLSVDGCQDPNVYSQFGLVVTSRSVVRGNFASWYLTALECYLKDTEADMYAVFEDDLVISKGARTYLERTCCKLHGYYNLYTCPKNEDIVKLDFSGWFMSNQRGLGALALVFNRETLVRLLLDPVMLAWPRNPEYGTRKVDGAIATALAMRGTQEWCHSPSIVEHTGSISTIGNNPYPLTRTFRGETFDLRDML